MKDGNEEFKTVLKLLHILCTSGPATQTLQEALKMARHQDTHQILSLNHAAASEQETRLIENEQVFFQFIEQDFKDLDSEVSPDVGAYRNYLFDEYKRFF